MVDYFIEQSNKQEISVDEPSYFSLQKGEQITYKLAAEKKNDDNKVEVSLLNDNAVLDISQKTCKVQ